MKIRLVEFEGTADELAGVPELRHLLGKGEIASAWTDRPHTGPIEAAKDREARKTPDAGGRYDLIPSNVMETLRARAKSDQLMDLSARFINDVLEWGEVTIKLGQSSKSTDGYAWNIRVGRKGGPTFALVDARRSSVIYRLREDVVEACSFAFARKVRPDAAYRVKLRLDSTEALGEAMLLAKEAYEESVD